MLWDLIHMFDIPQWQYITPFCSSTNGAQQCVPYSLYACGHGSIACT